MKPINQQIKPQSSIRFRKLITGGSQRLFSGIGLAGVLATATTFAGDSSLNGYSSLNIASSSSRGFGNIHVAYTMTEQVFEVCAQFLPIVNPATPYTVWLQAAAGSETFFHVDDMRLVKAWSGNWRLELRTAGQPPAALGVELSELSGRLVQVREYASTNVALWGVVPLAIPPDEPTGESLAGQVDLQRPPGVAAAHGFVALHQVGTNQTFTLRAWKLDGPPYWPNAYRIFSTYLETGRRTDDYTLIGNLSDWLKVGGAYWELSLWNASGVADLAALAGRRVQVRDDLDQLWLETELPALAPMGTLRTTVWRIPLIPVRGQSHCDVNARGLVSGHTYGVFVEDGPGMGTFTHFAPLDLKGKLSSNTARGDRLPFGVPRIIDLAGRTIEIRDQTGLPHLRGQLPATVATDANIASVSVMGSDGH